MSWLRWAFVSVGYWIRPYDMLADRRRWFWQPQQRCGAPQAVIDAVIKMMQEGEKT